MQLAISPLHCYQATCDEKEGCEALIEDVVAGGAVRKTAQQSKARQCHREAAACYQHALNQHLKPAFSGGLNLRLGRLGTVELWLAAAGETCWE